MIPSSEDLLKLQQHVVAYAETDLLMYWAPEPAELVAQQKKVWQPFLDQLQQRHKIALPVTTSLIPIPPSPELQNLAQTTLQNLSPQAVVAFQRTVASTGSFVLALASQEQWSGLEDIWAAASLPEVFQAEKWGWDDEAKATLDAREQDFFSAAAELQSAKS